MCNAERRALNGGVYLIAGPETVSAGVRARKPASRRRRLCYCIQRNSEALMALEDYKTILYRQEDGSWVADIPAIPGCYALMPTREQALAELSEVFGMIAKEYAKKRTPLPVDTTEILHA
jgi:predicted RNase H-like HicB family nuclease